MKKVIAITHIAFLITSAAFTQDAEYLFKYGTRHQKITSINRFMRQKSNVTLMVISLKNESEDIYIRKYILHALTVFKNSKNAKNAVIWALESDNETLKQSAARVASSYKLRDFLYPLLSVLMYSKDKTKVSALITLSKIGDLNVLPYLKSYMKSNNPLIRYHAKKAYNEIIKRLRG